MYKKGPKGYSASGSHFSIYRYACYILLKLNTRFAINDVLHNQNGRLVEFLCCVYTPRHDFKSRVAIILVMLTRFEIDRFSGANRWAVIHYELKKTHWLLKN